MVPFRPRVLGRPHLSHELVSRLVFQPLSVLSGTQIPVPANYQLEVPEVHQSSESVLPLDSQTLIILFRPRYSAGRHSSASRTGEPPRKVRVPPSPCPSSSQWQEDLLVQCQRRLVFNPLSVLSGTANPSFTYQLEVPGPAQVVRSSAKSVRLDSQTPVVRRLGPGYSAGPPDLSHALVSRRGGPSPT